MCKYSVSRFNWPVINNEQTCSKILSFKYIALEGSYAYVILTNNSTDSDVMGFAGMNFQEISASIVKYFSPIYARREDRLINKWTTHNYVTSTDNILPRWNAFKSLSEVVATILVDEINWAFGHDLQRTIIYKLDMNIEIKICENNGE